MFSLCGNYSREAAQRGVQAGGSPLRGTLVLGMSGQERIPRGQALAGRLLHGGERGLSGLSESRGPLWAACCGGQPCGHMETRVQGYSLRWGSWLGQGALGLTGRQAPHVASPFPTGQRVKPEGVVPISWAPLQCMTVGRGLELCRCLSWCISHRQPPLPRPGTDRSPHGRQDRLARC